MKIKWHVTSPTQWSAVVDGYTLLAVGTKNGPFLSGPWTATVKCGAFQWSLTDHDTADEAKSAAEAELRRELARPHLRCFTREGICSDEQKHALKAVGWIEYGSRMWNLTEAAKLEAERLGYL